MQKARVPLLFIALCAISFLKPMKATGQTRFASEESFHDLFVTAGYSTAFGAALGAAVLGLSEDPSGNLRYIAVGASLGFIAGSLFGTYLLISPVLSYNSASSTNAEGFSESQLSANEPTSIAIKPHYDLKSHEFTGIEAQWAMLRF